MTLIAFLVFLAANKERMKFSKTMIIDRVVIPNVFKDLVQDRREQVCDEW